MPRFYMNIRHGDELVEDHEGEEFSTLAEARHRSGLVRPGIDGGEGGFRKEAPR